MGASVGSPLEQCRCVGGGRQTVSASGHRETTAVTIPGAKGTLQMGTFQVQPSQAGRCSERGAVLRSSGMAFVSVRRSGKLSRWTHPCGLAQRSEEGYSRGAFDAVAETRGRFGLRVGRLGRPHGGPVSGGGCGGSIFGADHPSRVGPLSTPLTNGCSRPADGNPLEVPRSLVDRRSEA
jgi:hypothetical protein